MIECGNENHKKTIQKSLKISAKSERKRENLHLINAVLYVAENGCKWGYCRSGMGNIMNVHDSTAGVIFSVNELNIGKKDD